MLQPGQLLRAADHSEAGEGAFLPVGIRSLGEGCADDRRDDVHEQVVHGLVGLDATMADEAPAAHRPAGRILHVAISPRARSAATSIFRSAMPV